MGQWDEQQRSNANGRLMGEEETEAEAQIQKAIENARHEIETYVESAADFIRQRPVASVAAAVGIGFLIGKLASRR